MPAPCAPSQSLLVLAEEVLEAVVAALDDIEDLSVLPAEDGVAEEAVTIACEMGENELGSGPAVIAVVVFLFVGKAMELVLKALQVGFHAAAGSALRAASG